MKRKILLITTKNCLGCIVQSKNVQTAIAKSSIGIQLEIVDFQDKTDRIKRIIYNNKIYDYPATVFMKGDEVTFVYTGSIPVVVIQQFIKVHLN